MSDDEDFAGADAGGSDTYPLEAGQIKKGGALMVKGRPCVVKTVSDISNGKHGAAKHHYVAIDMFTGAKVEEILQMLFRRRSARVGGPLREVVFRTSTLPSRARATRPEMR